jgi:hypothetical protein
MSQLTILMIQSNICDMDLVIHMNSCLGNFSLFDKILSVNSSRYLCLRFLACLGQLSSLENRREL